MANRRALPGRSAKLPRIMLAWDRVASRQHPAQRSDVKRSGGPAELDSRDHVWFPAVARGQDALPCHPIPESAECCLEPGPNLRFSVVDDCGP